MRKLALLLAMLTLRAQAPRPEFEVASIKPTAPGAGERAFMGTRGPGRFDASNIPIREFVAEAYSVKTFEIYGAPAWLAQDRYDVAAKTGETAKKSLEEAWAEMRLRLQALLEDRCALKVHRETKELPVYALTHREKRRETENAGLREVRYQ